MNCSHGPALSIDKNGLWYADGVQMIRKEIIERFASHLEKDAGNNYYVNWQNAAYPVKVEDAPFLAASIQEQDGRLMLQLMDGRAFPLPQGKIVIKNHIPYISLFWPWDTRLSRHAYWELCEHMTQRDGRYYIQYGGGEWQLDESV